MTKDKGLIKSYAKTTVDNMDFVRVTNLAEDGELINITMYLSCFGKYKKVYPEELPYEVVNKLSLEKGYQTMTEEEVVVFSKTLDEMILMITDKNRFAPFKEMEIGQILGFPYITTRSTDVNLKYVNAMKINEFSIIEQITGFPPQELPYLIMSFIEQSKDFKSETYLVDNNIFAHVEKIGDDYLTLLYELTIEDEVSQKAKLKLINSFTIIDKENKFTLIKDDKSEFAIKLEQLQFEEVNKRFTENLKFDIIA